MAQLLSGVLFDDDSSSSTPSSARLSGLKGSISGTEDNDFLASHTGGIVLSLRPAVRPSAEYVPLIEGRYLDIAIEYQNDGLQFRFMITPTGANPIATPYVSADNPHTLALSYDAQPKTGVNDPGNGVLYVALDGTSQAYPSAFIVDPFNLDTTSNADLAPTGKFNGHLSAITIFQELLSQSEVELMSNNPEAWMPGFTSFDAPTLEWPEESWADNAAVYLTGILGGTQLIEPSAATGGSVQVLTIRNTLSGNEKITLSVPSAAYGPQTYTVTASDAASLPSPLVTVARNVVTNIEELGGNVQLNYVDPNNSQGNTATSSIVFTGSNNFVNNPVKLAFVNSQGVTESALQHFYDFRTGSFSTSPVSGLDPTAGNNLSAATNTARVNLSLSNPAITFYSDVVTTTVQASPSGFTASVAPVVPVGGAIPNGPIYSQINKYETDGDLNTPGSQRSVTYDLFIDPNFDLGNTPGYNTFGFTVLSDQPLYEFVLAPANDSVLNNALQKTDNKIALQWLKQTAETDYSKPIGQVKLLLADGNTSARLSFSNISIDNEFYTNADATAMQVAESVNTERFKLTGNVKQLPYSPTQTSIALYNELTDTDNIDPIPLVGSVASYEVFQTTGSYGAKLKLNEPLHSVLLDENGVPDLDSNGLEQLIAPNETSTTKADAVASFDIVVPAGTSSYVIVIELPYNAAAPQFTAATGLAGSGTQAGRLFTVTGTASSSPSEQVIGEFRVDLDLTYGLGVDFEFARVLLNDGPNTSSGRPSHVGIAKANATGEFEARNLIRGEVDVHLWDTTSVKSTSRITLDDARAVLNLAAAQGADMATLASIASVSPSDLVAADFNRDGRITAEDALAIIRYVAEVTKTRSLDYKFFDNVDNDPTKNTDYTGGLTNVLLPPVSNRLTTNKYLDPINFTELPTPTSHGAGDGPLVQYVGVLVGDVVPTPSS